MNNKNTKIKRTNTLSSVDIITEDDFIQVGIKTRTKNVNVVLSRDGTLRVVDYSKSEVLLKTEGNFKVVDFDEKVRK